jgi:hypothetical protein
MGHDHALATLRCQRLGDRPSTRQPRRGLDRRGPTPVATNEAAMNGRSARRRIGYSEPLPHRGTSEMCQRLPDAGHGASRRIAAIGRHPKPSTNSEVESASFIFPIGYSVSFLLKLDSPSQMLAPD